MRRRFPVPLLFVIALAISGPSHAQEGVEILLGKARALEVRGRLDLAAQNWNQVLLVKPKQPEALAGLARFAKEKGDTREMRSYLERLRQIDPKHPAIAAVERYRVLTPQQRARLDEAGRLAAQQKPDEAMKVYREVFGDGPPSGRWTEGYYMSEAASTGGREKAIADLRRLCAAEPDNEVYRLWLARILTYESMTRIEAFRLFESIRDSGAIEQARSAWRQALIWEKQNPAAQPSLEAYLRRNTDPELQEALRVLREQKENADRAATEQRGFQALRNKDLGTAEARFEDVLRRSPKDADAMAGLAFVRLDQKRFADAVSVFERARALAPQRADIRDGYTTAKFWLAIDRGGALQKSDPAGAVVAYREALSLRPDSEEAEVGIALALVRQDRRSEAESMFERVVQRSSDNADALAGLAGIRLHNKRFDDAERLFDRARTLAPDRPELDEGFRTSKFWGLMTRGAQALEQDRADTATAAYQQALTLNDQSADAWLGMARAAERKRDDGETINAYTRLTSLDPQEPQAWLGLVRTQSRHDPGAAVQASQRIPPAPKRLLEARPDYLAAIALAHYRARQTAAGDEALRRALDVARSHDTPDAFNARLEVAGLLADEGDLDRAVWIYQQATQLNPVNAVAWQGLIVAYTRVRDFPKALAAVREMPRTAYEAAAKDTGFLNAIGVSYSADGQCAEAERVLSRALDLDTTAGRSASGTRLMLADIWMRTGRYANARNAYRDVIAADANSVDGWRGYITVLHAEGNEQTMLAEAERMSPVVRTKLETEPSFLTLLASANTANGQHARAIEQLERARARYRDQGQAAPVDSELQLAWAMLELPARRADVNGLLTQISARTEITGDQRRAVQEIGSLWRRRSAEEALQAKQPERAIAVLRDGVRELPGDPKLNAALAAIYTQQRDFDAALDVYHSWGMTGADVADYRAAAGAATSAHKTDLAESYVKEGLGRWPRDADLLRMAAHQAVSDGSYKAAEGYLKSALRFSGDRKKNASESTQKATSKVAPKTASLSLPACRQDTARRTPSGEEMTFVKATAVLSGTQSTSKARARSVPPVPQSRLEPAQSDAPSAQSPAPAVQESADDAPPAELQDELDLVQHRNTPFVLGGGSAGARSGDPGINRLIVRDTTFGGSVTAGNKVRFGVDVHRPHLSTGMPDGRSGLRFGTLEEGATFNEQTVTGYAGEVQISTDAIGVAFGASPREFPVPNVTGGIRVGTPGGLISLHVVRDHIRDSFLSYAGALDPGTGTEWGGVVSNAATLRFSHDVRGTGQYLSAGAAAQRGRHVADNWSLEASAGSYWRVVTRNDGGLSVGVNASAMHYDRNLSFFTFGHGGYFSPQRYLLGSVPITWRAREGRVEYEVAASAGAQYIAHDEVPFYPLDVVASSLSYEGEVHRGANYDVGLRLAYRVAPHVFLGAFAAANNTRDFNARRFGITLKVLGQRLPTNTDLRVKSVPDWRGVQPFDF